MIQPAPAYAPAARTGPGAGPVITVVLLHAFAFFGTWIAAVLVAGGGSEFGRWFQEGGAFMFLLALMIFVQTAAGLSLGLVHLYRPLPAFLHLLAPAMTLLLGTAGAAFGMMHANQAMAFAAGDMALEMYGAALGIAENPRQFALVVAGMGGLPLIAVAAMGLHVRARNIVSQRIAPAPPMGLIVGVAGGLGLVAAAAVSLIFALQLGPSLVAVSVWLTLIGIGAVVLMAFGARAAWRLSTGSDETLRAIAAPGAVLCALGGVLALAGQGLAIASRQMSTVFNALSYAAPEMKLTLLASGADSAATSRAVLVFVAAILVAGLIVLWAASDGMGEWLRRRGYDVGLVLLLVAAVMGLDTWYCQSLPEGLRNLTANLKIELPAELALPTSRSAEQTVGEDPLLVVHGGALTLDGDRIGSMTDAAALTKLIDHLRERAEAGPPGGVRHMEWLMRSPAKEDDKEFPKLGTVALAVDGRTKASELEPLLVAMREAGNARLRIMVRDPQARSKPDPQREQLIAQLGLLGEYARALEARNLGRVVPLSPGPDPRVTSLADKGDRPALGLRVEMDGQALHVGGTGGTLEPIPPAAGKPDLEALRSKLAQIKDQFPDETSVGLRGRGGATIQNLIALLEITLEARDESGMNRTLFPDASWIAPTNAEPSEEKLVSMIREKVEAQRLAELALSGIGTIGLGGIGTGSLRPNRNSCGASSTSEINIAGLDDSRPKVTPGSAEIKGSLDKTVIQRVIRRHVNRIRHCYEKNLQVSPSLAGKITVRMVIGIDGKVTSAEAAEDTLGWPETTKCVLLAIRRIRFPKPEGGGIVIVVYPFVFNTAE